MVSDIWIPLYYSSRSISLLGTSCETFWWHISLLRVNMSFLDRLEAGNSGRVPEPVTQTPESTNVWGGWWWWWRRWTAGYILIHNTQPITAPHRLWRGGWWVLNKIYMHLPWHCVCLGLFRFTAPLEMSPLRRLLESQSLCVILNRSHTPGAGQHSTLYK